MSPLDKNSRGRKDAGKELPVSEFGQPFDMVVDDSLFDASGAEEESIETPLKEDSLLNFSRQGSSQEASPGAGENTGGSVFDLDRELAPPSKVDEEKSSEDILQTEGTSLGWPFTEEDQPARPGPAEAPPAEPLQEDPHGIDALFADDEQTGMETSPFDFPEEESQGVDVLFAEAKRQKPQTAESTEAPRAAMPEPQPRIIEPLPPEPQPRIIEPLPAEAPAAEAPPLEQPTTEAILADAIPATSEAADLFADEGAPDDFPPLDADAPAMSSEDSALLESFAHAAVPPEQHMMPELEEDPLADTLQTEEQLPSTETQVTETQAPVEDALESPVELPQEMEAPTQEMEAPTPSLDGEIPESLAPEQETDDIYLAEKETEFTDDDLEGLPLFDDMDETEADSFEPSAGVTGSSDTFSFKGGEVESTDEAEEAKSPGGRFLRFPLAIPALSRKGLIIGIGAAAAAIVLLAGVFAVLMPSEIEEPVPGETVRNATDTVPPVPGGDPPLVKDPSTSASGTGGDTTGDTMTGGFDLSPNKGASDLQLKGMSLFRDKRYVEAIEAFERDITSSTLFLARCYQILGENEEALKRYQRVLWEYPDRSAFIEVFALAEEMFAAGDYEAARKLYYAFLAQEDRMPGSVSKLASKAYFKIGRCLEKEALDLLEGGGPSEDSRDNPEDLRADPSPSLAGAGDLPRSSWILSPPARIELRSNQVNDLYTTFSMECVGAPGIQVFERLAKESGRELQIEEGLEKRLGDEVVSAFLKDRRLETILEYITGQLGLTYTLDRRELSIADLGTRVNGDWLAMKDEAIKTLRSSLYRFRGHEDSAKVYFEISRLHCLSGEFDSAIDPARTLIVEYPEFSQVPAALLNISSCYLELGDYSKARENLSELISKYPTHPATLEGYLLLARAQWLDDNPVAAQLTLRSMNDRFPESHLRHEGLAVLARILNSLGDFGSVVNLLEGVVPEEVEKKETAVSILLLYSEAHLRRGDPRSAADAAVKMIETFPGNAREKDALYLLAEAYTHLGEHFLAYAQCKVLKERFEETQSDSFLYTTAAQALRELDFRDQALEWLDEGLTRCPAERNATYEMYMLLGDILFEMEMYERAKVVFKKVFGHDALEKDAQVKYVLAQMKQKDYREALRTLRGMEEQAYGDPAHLSEIYKMAGDCFSAMGNMEAAIAAYIGELKDVDDFARKPNENE